MLRSEYLYKSDSEYAGQSDVAVQCVSQWNSESQYVGQSDFDIEYDSCLAIIFNIQIRLANILAFEI
eukprot:1619381-Heterocapsa_arctica.AAC.1